MVTSVAKTQRLVACGIAPAMAASIYVAPLLGQDDNPPDMQRTCAQLLRNTDGKAPQQHWNSGRLVLECPSRFATDFGPEFQALLSEGALAILDRAGYFIVSLVLVQAMWGKAASAPAPKDWVAALESGHRLMAEDGLQCHVKPGLLLDSLKHELAEPTVKGTRPKPVLPPPMFLVATRIEFLPRGAGPWLNRSAHGAVGLSDRSVHSVSLCVCVCVSTGWVSRCRQPRPLMGGTPFRCAFCAR